MKLLSIGRWAFLLGVLISLLAGLGGQIPYLPTILFVLGLVVGFLNIGERESTPFLIAVIALLMVGLAGLQFGTYTTYIVATLENLIAFVSAAAVVVALKQVLTIAKKA